MAFVLFRNRQSAVGAHRVEDEHLVGPADDVRQGLRDVRLLVVSEDDDGHRSGNGVWSLMKGLSAEEFNSTGPRPVCRHPREATDTLRRIALRFGARRIPLPSSGGRPSPFAPADLVTN